MTQENIFNKRYKVFLQGKEIDCTAERPKWERGCGKHRTLPENCEFCVRDKCFYNGMEVDR